MIGRCAGALALVGCITELPTVEDPCAPWEAPGLYTFTVNGRRARIEVPATAGPRPAVIALHGARQSGPIFQDVSRFDARGSREGFVTVFPDGTGRGLGAGRTWNAEGCCPPAMDWGVDDVAQLDAVAEALRERVCVDRPYAAGFSNGAMMALRWACEGQHAAGVVASAGPWMAQVCSTGAVPVLLAHGLMDRVVPFEGGTFLDDGVHPVPSSDTTLAVFLERNRCEAEPVLVQRGAAVCEVYPCEVPVERCTLEALGHQWPGGMHAEAVGFDLTTEALGFFESAGG